MKATKILCIIAFALVFVPSRATERIRQNFNSEWRLHVGDDAQAALSDFDDSRWQQITLPYAFTSSGIQREWCDGLRIRPYTLYKKGRERDSSTL